MAELDAFPGRAGILDTAAELSAHGREGAGLDALEAVDRLFRVADGEDRAQGVVPALAGEEIRGERADDRPLPGVGVLGLVDQHMVDPAVQLVEHPERGIPVLDQPLHPGDQVVVVEPSLAHLLRPVGGEQRRADPGQRRALGGGPGGEQAFADPLDAHRLRPPGIGRLGRRPRHRPGRQPEADFPRLGQKSPGILGEGRLRRGRVFEPGGDRRAGFRVGFPARKKRLRRARQTLAVERVPGAGGGEDRLPGLARVEAEIAVRRRFDAGQRRRGQRLDPAALAREVRHQPVELALAAAPGDDAEGPGERRPGRPPGFGDHRIAGPAQGLSPGAFVHHPEMRIDPGFQRKTAEHGLAEGVDGLDLHPARRVEHFEKQRPRPGHGVGIGRCFEKRRQRVFELGVGQNRPAAERGENPVGHLGRRRAGEGEGEDARRRRAAEQQPQHPVGEHLGLAGPGGRVDPGRDGGARSDDLAAGGAHHRRAAIRPCAYSARRSRCS